VQLRVPGLLPVGSFRTSAFGDKFDCTWLTRTAVFGSVQLQLPLTLDFGFSIFSSETGVYLALESYIRSTSTLGAEAGTVRPCEEGVDAGSTDSLPSTQLEERAKFPGPKTPSTTPETANILGCFEANVFFDFNMGATTGLFGFGAYTGITLFRKKFHLLKV
jgi:hypothetical protein